MCRVVPILCEILLCCGFILAQKRAVEKCGEYFRTLRRLKVSEMQDVSESDERVFNDEEVFPHMVALGYGHKSNVEWHCGGTLISEDFVLTSAHCTLNREFGPVRSVHVGHRYLGRSGKNHIIGHIETEKTIIHPSYRPPSEYNDLALIKLRSRVSFSTTVFPACLNTAFDLRVRSSVVEALGWERLDFLEPTTTNVANVDLNLYLNKYCKEYYKSVSKLRMPKGVVEAEQFCAGGRRLGGPRDRCEGFEGAPAQVKIGELYVIVGVKSFGTACDVTNVPEVFTRVSAHVPWIESIVW